MIKCLLELECYQKSLWIALGADESDDALLLEKLNEKVNLVDVESVLGEIPCNFKDIISTYDVSSLEIGYFNFGGSSKNKYTFGDMLIHLNIKACILSLDFLREKNLICIGSRPDYTICVARASQYFSEDQIVLVDDEIIGNESNPRPEDIQIAADNFEEFLIIIGNLNQLHREVDDDDSNYDEKRSEFVERLKILNVNEKYYDIWKMLF